MRNDQPTIDFVSKVIVNHVVNYFVPDRKEGKKLVESGKLKEFHQYAADIIGGYFKKKDE